MRLSMSGTYTGHDYTLEAAVGHETGDGGVPQGSLLNDFVAAVCLRDESMTLQTRQDIRRELGDAALVDISAVMAAFNGYPRAADGTGIPLEDYKEEATRSMRSALGLDALNQAG